MTMYWFYMIKLDERGATAIEYGLVAALIAMAIVGSIGAVGSPLEIMVNGVANAFPG